MDCAPRHWHLAWLQNVQVSAHCTKCTRSSASHTEQAAPRTLLISWAAGSLSLTGVHGSTEKQHSASLGSAPASREPWMLAHSWSHHPAPPACHLHWLLQPHPCTHQGQQQSLFRHCQAFVLPTDILPGDGCRGREYLLVSLLHRGKEKVQPAYVAWQNTLPSTGDDQWGKQVLEAWSVFSSSQREWAKSQTWTKLAAGASPGRRCLTGHFKGW